MQKIMRQQGAKIGDDATRVAARSCLSDGRRQSQNHRPEKRAAAVSENPHNPRVDQTDPDLHKERRDRRGQPILAGTKTKRAYRWPDQVGVSQQQGPG